MNFIRKIFTWDPLKKKALNIEEDILALIKPICNEKVFITQYGAIEINPKFLVYWICVKSDKVKLELERNASLNNKLRELLIEHEYPKEAIESVFIGFESKETVDRESKGNWYVHFK